MGTKMDGKACADNICDALRLRCDRLIKNGTKPVLTIVTSGDDMASKVYVKNKVKRCEDIGIKVDVRHYDCLTTNDFRNLYYTIHNPMIIQEPITGNLTHKYVAEYINPVYDADGFAFFNVACLAIGSQPYNYPCTPKGVMELLNTYHVPIEGKKALVIGRSNIVGRPMAMMLEHAGATVILAHSKTPEEDIVFYMLDADIIVSAVGKRNYINSELFDKLTDFAKDKTIVDIGMNRDENGKLCGDFKEDFKDKFKFYTSTPGGTGPMTIAMLMQNVIETYESSSAWHLD